MTKRIALILSLLCLGLTACGRKSTPHAPEDAIYPQVYPKVQQAGDHWVTPKDALDTDPLSNSEAKSNAP